MEWILFIHKDCSMGQTEYFLSINKRAGANIDVKGGKGELFYLIKIDFSPIFQRVFEYIKV